MPQRLITFACLLLAIIVGAGAQVPAPGQAAAGGSRATAGAAPAPAPAAPQTEPAPAATTHHGHHIFGMPLKWVIVGVATVLSAITIAAIIHNYHHYELRPPN